MKCPGSVRFLGTVGLGETEEHDYTKAGTAVHAAAAACLAQGSDAWEVVGQEFEKVKLTVDMTSGLQVYLDEVRRLQAVPNMQSYVEYKIKLPHVHPKYFGTLDYGQIEFTGGPAANDVMRIVDYKNGFLPVEVDSPQFKYYAYGLMFEPDARNVTDVEIIVVQPNSFHPDGPVRRKWFKAADIHYWVMTELKPAMERTEEDDAYLWPGEHCRFCPAKLVCPAMHGMFAAALDSHVADVKTISEVSLGQDYRLAATVKMYLKALEEEVYNRLMTGKEIQGVKLVAKKADRVWKDGSEARFRDQFGEQALTTPTFKTPAQMEIVLDATELVKEWAYTPQTGLTVALAEDKRRAVKVDMASKTFAGLVDTEGSKPISDA